MISPFEVYLFMQIGSIAFGFVLVACFCSIFSMVLAMKIDTQTYDEEKKDFTKPKRLAIISVALFVFASLIPSRETIAAMYLVPKLTSKEFVEPATAEAKELYALLKKALKDKGEEK